MSQQRPLSEFNNSAMANLRALVDANAVVGDPITITDGITIIPFSKVSFGYGSGGSDLPSQSSDKFAAGSGGGVTINPLGFLVVKNGHVDVIYVDNYNTAGDRLVSASASAVDKIIDLIPSKKDKDNSSDNSNIEIHTSFD